MSAMKACVLAAFGVATLTGCTTVRTLSVSPENSTARANGEVSGERIVWLQSAKKNTVAVCLLTPAFSIRLAELAPPAFLVVVRNGGEQTISLSGDDVTATLDGRPIHLLTSGEYLAAIHNQEVWVSAKMRWADEGPLGKRNDYIGPASDFSAVARTPGDALRDVDLFPVLGQYSIAPEKTIQGVVRFKPSELSRGQRLRIVVRAGDETHEFVYDVGH